MDAAFLAELRAVAESTAKGLRDRASLARDADHYQAAEVAELAVPMAPEWERAFVRGTADRQAGHIPERIADGHYRIPTKKPNYSYEVRIQSAVSLQAHCTCPAGSVGIPCRHAASAITMALKEQAE